MVFKYFSIFSHVTWLKFKHRYLSLGIVIYAHRIRIVKMNDWQRHILIGEGIDALHAAAAAAVVGVMHRNDYVGAKLVCQWLCLIARHRTEATRIYHKDISAEELILLTVCQKAAKVAHVNYFKAVPLNNMYLVFAAQTAVARIVEGVDDLDLVRAASHRAGELHSLTVIVSSVLVAAQHSIRRGAHRRIVGVCKVIGVYDKAVSVMAYLKAGMSEPAYLYSLSPFHVS